MQKLQIGVRINIHTFMQNPYYQNVARNSFLVIDNMTVVWKFSIVFADIIAGNTCFNIVTQQPEDLIKLFNI